MSAPWAVIGKGSILVRNDAVDSEKSASFFRGVDRSGTIFLSFATQSHSIHPPGRIAIRQIQVKQIDDIASTLSRRNSLMSESFDRVDLRGGSE